jgi:hypothetical protein
MTNEEIEEFKRTIEQTIIPNVMNLQQDQIIKIIEQVPEVSDEFKNTLLEQIIILKEKKRREQIF